ncbi:MAG TPA: hypothetical protein VLJ18_03785 [Thermoanaerobaculia bacterium]|nr:hypothetical protein [Thermoanaerobaculia bacterium]
MNRTPRETLIALAAIASLALAASAAQEPALSGLTPEPTPASATSLTPVPTPAAPVLSGGKTPASGTGHSLADVVKRSKEARKDQPKKKSLGTITNETLRKGAPPTPTPKGAAGKGPSGKQGTSPAVPSPSAPYVARDDKGRSEDDWRRLVDRSKEAVQNGELRVRELETKSKQLENDFYAMSDGNRRDAVVKPAWDKAREDLAKARQELEDARKAFDDLSEEARKSNAPPGWLR